MRETPPSSQNSLVILSSLLQQPHLNSHNATTMSESSNPGKERIPLLLLKTKSSPNDGYEEQFSVLMGTGQFEPVFVPVLEHKFLENGLNIVKDLLQKK